MRVLDDKDSLRLLQHYMDGFAFFVESRDGIPFNSFSSSRFMKSQEGYKDEIFERAQKVLDYQGWKATEIGHGRILGAFKRGFLMCANLVDWRNVHPTINLMDESLAASEEALYAAFVKRQYEKALSSIVSIVGRYYDVLSYTFFLADRSRFLPIRPRLFDKSFSLLGVDYVTNRRCSWENYCGYTEIISEIRECLRGYLDPDATLVDAHSFVWMADIVDDFLRQNHAEDSDGPREIAIARDRLTVSKARIGQERYRASLVKYWNGSCAVTGCTNEELLVASHIKPWAECGRNGEWVDSYNGLLLAAGVDAAFDKGFISFGDDGSMLMSSDFSVSDAIALGIPLDARLTRVDQRHKPYLEYHRQHVFRA